MRYYEVEVKYVRQGDEGEKPVNETYAVSAQTFTDAEHKTIEHLSPFVVKGEPFEVTAMKIAQYDDFMQEIETSLDCRFYEVKCAINTIDERTAKDKVSFTFSLVEATDVQSAANKFKESMNGLAVDYDLMSVKERNIVDVFGLCENTL